MEPSDSIPKKKRVSDKIVNDIIPKKERPKKPLETLLDPQLVKSAALV